MLSSRVLIMAVAVLLLGGCSFGPADDSSGRPPNLTPPPSPSLSPSSPAQAGPSVQVLVKGLAVPWGVGFLPDGSALVTERDSHRLLTVAPSGAILSSQLIPGVSNRGESGLLGLAVSPRYAVDRTVFLYYTTVTDNRIARLVAGRPPVPILTGIPAAAVHDGGRLAFGPDGYLYAGTGDAGNRDNAQNPGSLGGKILRITTDGKPAPGNPVAGSPVWSLGHRNVQGLAWDSSKRLYAAEFGQDKVDELNLIVAGKNYGWPLAEGIAHDRRFIDPLTTWTVKDASPSGLAIVANTAILACLRGRKLYAVELDPATGRAIGEPQAVLDQEYGRLRTVTLAPDGSLWATTSNKDGRGTPGPADDRILRIVPPGGGGVSIL